MEYTIAYYIVKIDEMKLSPFKERTFWNPIQAQNYVNMLLKKGIKPKVFVGIDFATK